MLPKERYYKLLALTWIAILLFTPSVLHAQTWIQYDSLRLVYQQKEVYDTAIIYAEKALKAAETEVGVNDTLYAEMIYALYDLYYDDENYKKALEYAKQVSETRKRLQGPRHPAYIQSLTDIAGIYFQTGNFSLAEPLLMEIKDIYKDLYGDLAPDYLSSVNNLGTLYYSMGKLSKAEPLLAEAMNKRRVVLGENDPEYARSVNNLAGLYYTLGNLSKAMTLYAEAMSIRKEVLGEDHPKYALSLNNLAGLNQDLGFVEEAEKQYLEALRILKDTFGEKHTLCASILNNLGMLYHAVGNYSKADSFYTEATRIRKEILGEKHLDYIVSLTNLAILRGYTGDFENAIKLYDKVMASWQEIAGENNMDYIKALYNLALLYDKSGNRTHAEEVFLQCIDLLNKNILQNFSFLSESEKEKYFQKQSAIYYAFCSFALRIRSDRPDIACYVYNNILRNKGLLMKSSTAMRNAVLSCGDTVLIHKYDYWISLKKEISRLYSTEISMRDKSPGPLEEEANSVEKELVRESQVFGDFNRFQNLTWKNIRDSLKEGEAAVEFIRYKEGKDSTVYCALVLRKDCSYPEFIRLFGEKELSNVLPSHNGSDLYYINLLYGDLKNQNTGLYRLIWQPLEPFLKGVTSVFFSADGLLHKISFPAIGCGGDKFLCDKYNLYQLSSTAKIVPSLEFSFNNSASAGIFGGIDYSADSAGIQVWPYLEGTRSETEMLFGILKTRTSAIKYFSGKTASEEEFKNIAGNCNILHVSTHGFFYADDKTATKEKAEVGNLSFRGGQGFGNRLFIGNSDPLMRSGLVFAGANNVWNHEFAGDGEDGVLTAREVINLDMRQTRLLILSACETGLGDIKGSEGVYGLQRAFKMAGVKYIIMSLWQVPDKETVEFMETFYKKLLKVKDVRQAFNETQKEMRKKYDPYYWAAFVLVE